MAISDELTKLNDYILEAYQVIEDKGGTIPENKNMENLPAAIATLEDVKHPLCFTSTGESTIQLTINNTLTNAVDIYYSYDNSTWTSWLSGTSGSSDTLTLTDGQKLYIWNKSSTLSESTTSYVRFVMTGSIAASGNVDSMINYGELRAYCYYVMFHACSKLTSAPTLPSTTLAIYCYNAMFQKCTSLTTAPELPATTLADSCYEDMFKGCTSLTTTPELPATTLKEMCYYSMFEGCTSLKVNENGTSGTAFFTCPSTIPEYAVTDMFTNTGGTFTGTPTAGNTYKYY